MVVIDCVWSLRHNAWISGQTRSNTTKLNSVTTAITGRFVVVVAQNSACQSTISSTLQNGALLIPTARENIAYKSFHS